jgi:hypothetical protein
MAQCSTRTMLRLDSRWRSHSLSLTSMGQSSITSHPSEFQYKNCNEVLSYDINNTSNDIKKQYFTANTA